MKRVGRKMLVWVSGLALLFTLFIILLPTPIADHKVKQVIFPNGDIYHVEVVDTQKSRTQGLSGRVSLAEHSGMLFVLEKPMKQGIWMKEMLLEIDIVWINDGVVVHIVSNAPIPNVDGDTPQFDAEEIATHILELNSGDVEKLELEVGDKIILE